MTETDTLPHGTTLHIGRQVYICAAHDRRVYVTNGGDLVHFAGENAGEVCTAAPAPVEDTEHAFMFHIPMWVHVKDGKIVRVVADDNYPKNDEQPVAVVRDASEGWSEHDQAALTAEDVAEWFAVRVTDWPAWDFGW